MKPASKSKECTRHVKVKRPLYQYVLAACCTQIIVDRLHALGMLIAKRNSARLLISSRSGRCSFELLKNGHDMPS